MDESEFDGLPEEIKQIIIKMIDEEMEKHS